MTFLEVRYLREVGHSPEAAPERRGGSGQDAATKIKKGGTRTRGPLSPGLLLC